MENRFGLKDFIFATLFVVMIGAVVFAGWQFNYQEGRLTEIMSKTSQLDSLRADVQRLDHTQKQQLAILEDIKNSLQNGITTTAHATRPETAPATASRIRQKNPDGSQYVYYPDVPTSPRDPSKLADYAFGDWIVKNVGQEPATLQPFVTQDMAGVIAQSPALESLVSQNPDTQEWEPYLADKYWISADSLHFKFHIRPQACFSDGVKVKADDVVFSYNTVMNKDIDCEPLRGYFEKVTSCKKIDDQTVEFGMSEPYFQAIAFIGGLSIIPEHVYHFEKADDYNHNIAKLVGTGPYILQSWDKGQKVVFVRNENYWADRPTFDRWVFVFISNAQAQLESFLKGEIDELSEPIEPEPEVYLKYASDPEFLKTHTAYKFSRANSMYMYIGYNEKLPMFKDKETRQALTMLIDRKYIIDEYLKGFGTEMAGPFNNMRKQCDTTIKLIPFDPEGAKKKLAEAGWKTGNDGVLVRDGVRFEFALSMRTGVPIRDRVAARVQQWLRVAGIQMKITPYEPSVLFDRMNDRDFDAVLAGWGAGGVEDDPYQIFHSKSMENKGSNHVGYSDPEADKLMEEGRRTLDEDKRMEIWHEFQRICYDDQPYTWLYSEVDCAFIDGRFKNTKPYPTGLNEVDWYVPAAAQKYR